MQESGINIEFINQVAAVTVLIIVVAILLFRKRNPVDYPLNCQREFNMLKGLIEDGGDIDQLILFRQYVDGFYARYTGYINEQTLQTYCDTLEKLRNNKIKQLQAHD